MSEPLKARVKQLEQQMHMREESFKEERGEFEAAREQLVSDRDLLATDKAGLQATVAQLQKDVEQQVTLEERLKHLEQLMLSQTVTKFGHTTIETSSDQAGGSGNISTESVSNSMSQLVEGEAMGKEKSIELTFGDDTSPHMLEKFIAHYSLVDRINNARGVRVWRKSEYRALMVRSALRGAASELVENAEQIMLSPWVKNDQEIIEQLKQRYITIAAIELRIIQFETASQIEGEPLGEYLTRLQRLMENAYSSHPQYIKQVRVVWQFLNGLRDKDVREALIKEKWMADGQRAKSYDEILKVAEAVVNTKQAAKATGRVGAPSGVASVRQGSVSGSRKSPKNKGRYRGGNGSPYPSTSGGRDNSNWNCWYCKRSDHEGGWRQCPVRRQKDPQWKPGRNQDFTRTPHH